MAAAKHRPSGDIAGAGDDLPTVKRTIDASIFTADRSVFSRSFLTDRGRFLWQDARVGNTALPDSFSLACVYSTLHADDEVVGVQMPRW